VFTKGYGKQFTTCLDGAFTQFATIDDMVSGVRDFFNGKTAESTITYVPIEDL
jgi:hypothetical protein